MRSSREMVQSLGAKAFTVGQEIFTTSPDRALLAHELVHTVQQENVSSTEPSRIQASFEKTTTELDPKVEILLNLHLRLRGKQLKEIVETKLLVKESWWRKLRANLEKKDATPPVDAKAEVEAAVKQIRDLAPLDTAAGDPIQNGVAGLLADYLRINGAPELAAMVVIEFPYTRTAVPADEVVGALISEKKRGQRAVLALPRIWKYEKPTGGHGRNLDAGNRRGSERVPHADAAGRPRQTTAGDRRCSQRAAARDLEHSGSNQSGDTF